ncbi:hypothetical protein GGF32_006768 [Allomyces javanicus]|nr:hypothetical protein GGF32_006768 [Allomyces javanicus]
MTDLRGSFVLHPGYFLPHGRLGPHGHFVPRGHFKLRGLLDLNEDFAAHRSGQDARAVHDHGTMGQGQSRVVKLNNAHLQRHKIAIDFGTSHSGFAVSSCDFPDTLNHDLKAKDLSALQKLHIEHHIKYKTAWPRMVEPYLKTRTALLDDAQANLVAWGNKAFAQYLGMNSEVQAQHIYIDRFKLFLDDSRQHEDPEMEKLEALGKDVDKVIADYLRALAEAIREFVAHMEPNECVL